jgi:hypothetical protein
MVPSNCALWKYDIQLQVGVNGKLRDLRERSDDLLKTMLQFHMSLKVIRSVYRN